MQTPALVAVVAAFALCLTQAAVTDTHRCYVEPGFDYVDNDIGNVTSSTADGCCAKCEITTGCKAYSWTDLNGGTCWLKSGRGTIIVKSGVQSATLQSLGDSGSVGGCLLDEGIDYVGNDIGSVPMLKPLGCCSACLYFPGCRAFTFTTHNGGTCWLKSAKGPTIVNPTARSAQPYLEAPSCGLEFGVDYVGNDIGTASASKPGDCCDVCSKRDGCRAFSWTAQNGGTCWLKNRKDGSIVKAGVTSAQVKANPASHWNWMWTTRATTLVTLAALSRTLVAPSVWPKVAATLSRGRITRVERAGSRALRVTRKSRLASTTTTGFVVAIPEECVIEDGFDYIGNDLLSLTSVDAFECCHQCQQFASAGCRAYSWTDYQGGTCWLKTGRGTIAVNANAKSGTISSFRLAETCVLEHGIDYEGNDIATVKRQGEYDRKPCSSLLATICGGTHIHGVGYVGNDIGSARAAHANECCELCEAFGGCRAFSWNDHKGGTCWFKNRKDQVIWEADVYSGQTLANPAAPSCALELNLEYMGNNIGNASSLNAYGCCSICMKTAGCRAFSWTDLNGGVCFLKSAKGGTRSSAPFVSSVV